MLKNFTFNEQVICWVIRIVAGLSLITALILIQKTIKSWRLDNKQLTTDGITRNRYFKWLNRLSFGSMICNVFVLTTIISTTFPSYCGYTYGTWFQFWSLSKGFLGLFQIIRLQYTQSSSQIHSAFGWPKWLFYVLYSIAIVSILYHLGVSRFTFMMKTIGDTLCIEQIRVYKFVEYQLSIIVIELFMDMTIIILYSLKALQVMRKVGDVTFQADARLNIWKKMQYAVKKMLHLELILGCCSITQWIIYAMQRVPIMIRYQYFVLNMVHIIGSIVCVVIAYLMTERHDNNYRAIINSKCCCCCKSDIDDISDENESNDAAEKKCIEMTNTKTQNPIKRKHDSLSIESAMTQTLVNAQIVTE